MKDLVSLYLIVINIIGFIIMYVDKVKAIKHQWRVQEKTLIGIALIGGSIGSYLGMHIFRHKTKHPKFYIGIPAILIIELIICYYIFFEF
ncbi:DUF1294 domain-containing protein [uncultured Clostridium sp.]|uniref:DUF1294 domain-containing protein n=1 Tax=uncultured Clostridium sp. TaxID=59620 RepID=UPI00263861F4|nr:DUF1294 domain-containing protein [uncultured Clostridium sp.]